MQIGFLDFDLFVSIEQIHGVLGIVDARDPAATAVVLRTILQTVNDLVQNQDFGRRKN